jgi:hypothetical protein
VRVGVDTTATPQLRGEEVDKMSSTRTYRLRRRGSPRRRRAVVVGALVAVVFAALASSALAAHVNIVTKTPVKKSHAGAHYFTTIQAAVNKSKAGDYVLIEPGEYDEEVKVTSAQSGIWIRGMNRNSVIIDGQHKAGNGIEIKKANNVWVENLTVRNFDETPEGGTCGDEECGNEIWWTGGKESGKVGAHGWFGSYLTAYDTGLLGGYGLFAQNETEGSFKNIYASGFNDAGMYIGACQECKARVTGATMENNALGYSGSNAGGSLAIEDSLFRHNSVGINPNSENPGDKPPPQDGECNRENIEHPNPTPEIKETGIARCTVIRHNQVLENSNLNVPAVGAPAGNWGTGVLLPGDYADLIEENVIEGNANNGVLGLEYPNPFPPQMDTIYFMVAGNKVANNYFAHNGENPTYAGSQFPGDVMFTGGYDPLFGGPESKSVNNCVSGNVMPDQTFPANIEGEWGCQNEHTPVPGFGGIGVGLGEPLPESVEYLLRVKFESEARKPEAQKEPPEQETMPNPCEGVPKNPLCPKNKGSKHKV